MITLKTLPQATAQEVFDQVARHLLTQGKKSTAENRKESCMYRGFDGTKCAAGCLISDDEYKKMFENCKWSYLVSHNHIPGDHLILINRLQTIHDMKLVEDWKSNLNKLAHEFNLNPIDF